MEVDATLSNEVAQEYASSLADLTVNSKPLISMLTMLAEENIHHAAAIVQAVEKHLQQVDPEYKLPVLYLIDSIVKNVGQAYATLFTQNLVSTFCGVFDKVDEKTRAQMFKLRHTWNETFPPKKLYAMDLRVQTMDPAWPIPITPVSIHVNPKFLSKKSDGEQSTSGPSTPEQAIPASVAATATSSVTVATSELEMSRLTEARMREELLRKQKELLELQQKKIELELLQAKTRLEEQQRQMLQEHANLLSAAVSTDTAKAHQLLLSNLQTQHLKILEEQKAKLGIATTSRQKVQAPQVPLPPQSLPKSRSQVPQSTSSRESIISAQHLPISDPRKAAAAPENIPMPTVSTIVTDSSKSLAKPSTSSSTNKDFKATKDTFLNNDPRVASKRISPVPKSMAMLASNSSRDKVTAHALENLLPKPAFLKPKPTPSSPVKQKPSPVPIRSIPEIKTEPGISTVEVGTKAANVTSSNGSEGKRDGPSGSKKGSSKSPKKPSSSGKLDSPKLHRKKCSKRSNSSDNQQSKSSKDLSKSKDSRKDCKRKDGKRNNESASGSKSPSNKSKSDTKSGRVFKDVKGCRSRNYMRRNLSVSESPEPPSDTGGDVDLRNNGPPDTKIPRIFKEDPEAPQAGISPPFQLEVNSSSVSVTMLAESPERSQDILGKDVDLRQLPSSPLGLGKKRSPSTEKSDHPSPKKSKAEMIDVLFGNEDVDLRQLGPPIAPAEITEEAKARKKAPDWAKFKEFNPDTYRSPLKNSTWETSSEHGSQISDIEMPTPPPPPPKLSVSPNDPRSLNRSFSKDKPMFDRLGRPLLYNRLSIDDPRERRLSTSSLSAGEDTDMRRQNLLIEADGIDDMDSSPRNINIIIAQADEQLNNGTISFSQYNSLLKEMVHLNEVQKLREAQRRDEQESWGDNSGSDGWDRGSRSPEGSDRSKDSDRSPRRDGKFKNYNDEEKLLPKTEDKFGDIDERFAQRRRGDGVMPVGPNIGRGRGISSRSVGLPHPSHGPMSRPWSDNCGPNGPRPHWEEPGWNQRPVGPQGPNAIPPHIRPHFRGRGDFGGPRFPRFPQQPQETFNQRFPFNNQDQPRFRYQFRSELPPADPREVDLVNQDTMKMIQIDGFPRDIRYYGNTALIMMKWDDPRELSFQAGKRRVSFNECESVICGFGEPPQKVMLDGVIHTIQLGAPSRELYLDGKWYECYFGGPPMTVELHGKRCRVQLEGPPPQVSIGQEKRTDLVAGKINLIIDACNIIPIYLDPKPQKFVIDGKPHIFRFTDAFRTVIINGRPFRPQFGGLPMPIMVHGNRHYIGFSALPPDVKVGYIKITGMEGGRLPTPPPDEEIFEQQQPQIQAPQSQPSAVLPQAVQQQQGHQPAMPMLGRGRKLAFDQNRSSPDTGKVGVRHPQQQGGPRLPQRGQLDVLSSLMPGAVTAATGYSYQVQHDGQQVDIKPSLPQPTGAEAGVSATVNLNLGELMQKLVATGILPSADSTEAKREEDNKPIKPVTLTADSLKLRQAGIFTVLYSGIQCSSCGVRFPPEQTIKYSQHLDWHFRQNRRDRDSAKKAQSRKWYYDVSDWIQFEEIEDLEERAQSWFETQEAERPEEREQELLSVPAGENSEGIQCAMCHENFEQFYNEDKEEWHLKDAIRVDEKTYHPVCYEDFKNSMETSMDESMVQSEGQPEGETTLDESKPDTKAEESEVKGENDIKKENVPAVPCATDNKDEKPEGAALEEAAVPSEGEVVIKTEPIDIVIKEEPMETSDELDPPVTVEILEEDSVVNIESELLEVKTEPEEPEIMMPTVVDTTLNIVTSSIDGNVELDETAPMSLPAGKIKINISKPLPPMPAPAKRVESQSDDDMSATEQEVGAAPKSSPTPAVPGDDVWDEDAPPPRPPGEDTLHLKPRLVGRKLTEIPPVFKGTEVSGLCSIM